MSAGIPTPSNGEKSGKNKRGVYQSTVEIMSGEGGLKIGQQHSSQASADMKSLGTALTQANNGIAPLQRSVQLPNTALEAIK